VSEAPPFISVIVPAHNAARFLGETLRSVLAQGYEPLEVLVIDDGSTDGTAAIAEAFGAPVRCVRQAASGGPAAPRNRGVGLARGEVIAFLDADDLWPPDRLAVQVPHLADPSMEIVLGHTRRFWAAPGSDRFDRFTGPELAMKLCAALVRRSALDRIGGFDESLRICDDWDWFMRARELGIGIRVHPEVSILYRRHDANVTTDEAAGNREFMRILKRSLDRRRGGGEAKSMAKLTEFVVRGSRRACAGGEAPRDEEGTGDHRSGSGADAPRSRGATAPEIKEERGIDRGPVADEAPTRSSRAGARENRAGGENRGPEPRPPEGER
jgi:glycosyltransferase involved in cell wall biosynthesis